MCGRRISEAWLQAECLNHLVKLVPLAKYIRLGKRHQSCVTFRTVYRDAGEDVFGLRSNRLAAVLTHHGVRTVAGQSGWLVANREDLAVHAGEAWLSLNGEETHSDWQGRENFVVASLDNQDAEVEKQLAWRQIQSLLSEHFNA